MADIIHLPRSAPFPDRTWALEKADDLLESIRFAATRTGDAELLRPIACYATKLAAYLRGETETWAMSQVDELLHPGGR